MSWHECNLGDLITLKRGHDLPNTIRIEGDIPVVSSSGITGYHNEAKAKPPGVVTGRYGTLGEVFYIEQDYWPLNTALYVIDFKNTDPKFSAYFLKNTLKSYKSDKAAVPGVDRNVLHALKVRAPDRDTQKRIVNVLSKYDDLIENNKRRIELLEESARQLYKEWFVRFRFPGHEHVKIIDGVPEGWTKKKVSDFCTVGRGASPRPIQDYMNGEIPWFKISDATASESAFIFNTSEFVTEAGVKKSIFLPVGELILSNSATCGVPNFTGVAGCIHDGWLYFKDLKIIDKWFLYLYFVTQQKAILQGIGEGATQKNLNTTYVSIQEVVIPNELTLLKSFAYFVEPVFLQIQNLAIYNRQLLKARDLLLPKLMSGEIAV